jgi:hypothetical protein
MLGREEVDGENEWPIAPFKANLIVGRSVVLKGIFFRATKDCDAVLHCRGTVLQVD